MYQILPLHKTEKGGITNNTLKQNDLTLVYFESFAKDN